MYNSPYDLCLCKSGKKFKFCCKDIAKSFETKPTEQTYASFPVSLCMEIEQEDTGLKIITVGRSMPDGSLIFGSYLIDIWCLGVKNAIVPKVGLMDQAKNELAMALPGSQCKDISYDDARSIILGSIAYAESLGFFPHPDWHASKHLIEPDASFVNNCTFGRDGKPFYLAGPYDENALKIGRKVAAQGGEFMIRSGENDFI